MNTRSIFSSALAAASVVFFCDASANADDAHSPTSKGSKAIHEVMVKSAAKVPTMKMSGDTDKDFAKMMADHHRSGIKMAKLEVEHGSDPELKQLASKIIEMQQQELKTLEKHATAGH